MKILLLAGDGIGPEIMNQAELCLEALRKNGLPIEIEKSLVGGCAIDAEGTPLPESTLDLAKASDAILLGAVGGFKWEELPMAQRPEKGLLNLRKTFNLFANLRPAILYPQLAQASSLKPEIVSGLDILIVRELTGGIYFGEPRGITLENGLRKGFNTYVYDENEIRRIAKVAFELARQREGKLCSVDKANVLEVTELWRNVLIEEAVNYSDVELSHMYVDNAAMQLIKNPKQFDVLLTGNMFGDILSDAASMLTGSIGMLPSASMNADLFGMYEPIHGSAPDIAGMDRANPLAMMLSIAMMLRYTFNEPSYAEKIEKAVEAVLDKGMRTFDIYTKEHVLIGTKEMGAAVVESLQQQF